MIAKARDFFAGTPRRRRVSLWAGVTLIFALITWFYMGPALSSCSAGILGGGPGDGTAGLTWLSWIDKSSPIPGITHLTNAPFGESLRQPFQITSAYTIPTMWLLARLTSAVCAWNLMVFIGYMSSALVMFAFVRWLLKNNWVAFFAAYAVTFVPYHQFNAQGHLSYMFNALFVLLLWAFVVFWREATAKRAVVLGVATAACMYLDGYFILLSLVLCGSVIVGAFLADTLIFKHPAAYVLQRQKALGVFVITLAICLLPIAGILLKDSSAITSTLSSSRGAIGAEAQTYSARAFEYFLPADNTPFLPHNAYETFRHKLLHGSNYTESSLYVGLTTFGLAAFAWMWWFRNRAEAARLKLRDVPLPFVLVLVTFGLAVAFLVSLQPVAHVFGVKIPFPSWIVIHLTAMWRVFARLFLIVDLCLATLAAIGLWLLIRKWPQRRQMAAAVVAVAFLFIEFMTQSRAVVWSYNTIPAVYPWLATQQQVHIIAEYPLGEPPSQSISDYLTYQQISGKAIFNTSDSNSPERPLHLSMAGLADAQTLPILRTLGVDLVLSHRTTAPGSLSSDLQQLRYDTSHYNDDNVWTYKILPGERATYAVVAAQGFHAPVIDQTLHSKIGMGSLGVLDFQKLTPGPATDPLVHVSMSIASEQGDQLVTLSQNGLVRWQGTIGEATDLSFDADPNVALNIIPYHPTADETMQISNMKATL